MKRLFSALFLSIIYFIFSPFTLFSPQASPSSCSLSSSNDDNCLKHNISNDNNSESVPLEFKLKNGMRVCIKQSKKEPGTFEYQFFALGGYSSLPASDRMCAWLAPEIVIESGLAPLSGDELACALDDRGLEMEMKMGLFDRYIEAAGPSSEIAYSFQVIHSLFTRPQFTEEGLKKVVKNARQKLLKKQQKEAFLSDRIFLKVNLRNSELISPFSTMNLDSIQLQKISNSYKTFFSNPSEFMCVLIGDIDPQVIIPLLEETLGSLSPQSIRMDLPHSPPLFPEGRIKKEFFGMSRYKSSLTRITFPLTNKTLKPVELDLVCATLKQRLLRFLPSEESLQNSLKVFYEFPLFPCLESNWLVIQFSSHQNKVEAYSQDIFKVIDHNPPLTNTEIRSALAEIMRRKSSILTNTNELSQITNYYMAGWPLKNLYHYPIEEMLSEEMMKKISGSYPDLKQYSIISLHP